MSVKLQKFSAGGQNKLLIFVVATSSQSDNEATYIINLIILINLKIVRAEISDDLTNTIVDV